MVSLASLYLERLVIAGDSGRGRCEKERLHNERMGGSFHHEFRSRLTHFLGVVGAELRDKQWSKILSLAPMHL
jgi:hypothetical protein